MRKLNPIILLAALIFALVLWQRHSPQPGQRARASDAPGTAQLTREPTASIDLPAFLPPVARTTIERITRDGPFEHLQDGVVFGNYERLLPAQPRGYYHEYTVETPGAQTRGARRIITGGTPSVVFYYTDDHYRSFRRFQVLQ